MEEKKELFSKWYIKREGKIEQYYDINNKKAFIQIIIIIIYIDPRPFNIWKYIESNSEGYKNFKSN